MISVIAAPEMLAAAATDLAGVRSELHMAHTAAAQSTVAFAPAAADEVSAGIAQWFSEHAHGFHALAAQASVCHGQFVLHLKTGAGAYSAAEAHSAAGLGRDVRDYLLGVLEATFAPLASGDWVGFLSRLL